jgi:hypothetical protein
VAQVVEGLLVELTTRQAVALEFLLLNIFVQQ